MRHRESMLSRYCNGAREERSTFYHDKKSSLSKNEEFFNGPINRGSSGWVGTRLASRASCSTHCSRFWKYSPPGQGCDSPAGYGLGINPAQRLTQVEHNAFQQATTYLEQVTGVEKLRGITVTTHVLEDNPAAAILAIAQQQHATLIVLCSHGETGLKRWMLGSITERILTTTKRPLLMVRPMPEKA